MEMQLLSSHHNKPLVMPPAPVLSLYKFSSSLNSLQYFSNHVKESNNKCKQNKIFGLGSSLGLTTSYDCKVKTIRRKGLRIVASSSSNVTAPLWESLTPEKGSKAPSLSDIIWPSAGAFAAMAILGKIDQLLAPKGISMTIAPLGAVCAVLFATPSSPGARGTVAALASASFAAAHSFSIFARKYNMFMAQIGCAAIGVLAFTIFGPGWLARSTALAAAMAFMIYTRAVHPPAASLPLLFIDGAKLHGLNFWYALFPGAAGCILLCLIQEIVCYLKENLKF